MLAHQGELAGRCGGADPVGQLQHRVDDGLELLAAVHRDPPGVERVGGAGTQQLLADAGVDPVAGQHGGDGLGERPAVGRREQVADIGAGGRGDRLGRRGLGGQAEIGEQRRVQPLLGGDRAARVGAEHHGVARLLRPGPAEGQRAGVTAQVVGVLDDVVAKRLARQRAVGQPGDERVAQDRGVDVVDVGPEKIARSRSEIRGGHAGTVTREGRVVTARARVVFEE